MNTLTLAIIAAGIGGMVPGILVGSLLGAWLVHPRQPVKHLNGIMFRLALDAVFQDRPCKPF